MSVQGGIWHFDEKPADRDFVAKLSQFSAQYGPDGNDSFFTGPLGIFYRPFHTTKESRLECQPHISRRGNVLTWDGRLDNREELITELKEDLCDEHGDVAIVMAAYERWRTDCFPKLIGDWALALWNHDERSLILAKDFIGPRQLYYQLTTDKVFWCTHLKPMVLLAGHPFEINGEYIAGYLDLFPPAHLTPYVGIDAVPPGTFIQIRNGRAIANTHWSMDPSKKIFYRTDPEYEDQFRTVFQQAVKRRLRSDSPVLAELSGGMDSSSIVCMADAVIAEGKAETPRLDTISYYDDEEPNWDERPYSAKVEEKRGRKGTHINIGRFQGYKLLDDQYFCPLPGMSQSTLDFERTCCASMEAQSNRVLLSGVAGDEIMGGVPTPIPEIADLLVQLRLTDLLSQSKAWSIAKRQPWLHLIVEALGSVEPIATIRSLMQRNGRKPAPWLNAGFVRRYRDTFRLNRLPHNQYFLPSQQAFLDALSALRNQLACTPPPLLAQRDESYPFLDRNLVEFMFCIPRQQVLRPGQRRSLMRRSLEHLIPTEIAQRKRKAYVIRRPLAVLQEEWANLQDLFRQPFSDRMGLIDRSVLEEEVRAAIHGNCQHLLRLDRTFRLEMWLHSLSEHGVLANKTMCLEQRGVFNAAPSGAA